MSTVYLQSTTSEVYVAPTDHHHKRPIGDDTNRPFAIDCEACEKYLVREGAVYSPDLVPLTSSQVAEQEKIEREGNLAVKQAATALAESAASLLVEGRTRGAPKRIATD
jgi:hypothetical protein